ncbi:MAG: trigger factor [Bacteroidales bacterium]|nr:trigger factor [Lachnoclostridium sp.]MCM1383986.1 trigger factor [Lachnoclostridium sp.]MCM1464695.1 trigger factor [Bacteroidales bacterium]
MKKKKAVKVLAALLMMGILTGCGAKDGNGSIGESGMSQGDLGEEILLKDIEVEKYVTLGEYKGLKVDIAEPEVDEAYQKELVEGVYREALAYYAAGVIIEDGITDRAVADGDTVNIDYEGKKDGVAFDGGTAAAAYLIIGSGQFIDGFEEGLVGVMPGETVDLPLKFPEIYSNADLAGQEVVFTVTVNYIMPEGMHEAIIATLELENVTTGEDLEQYIHDFLMENEQLAYQEEKENAIFDLFMNNCTFAELPESLVSQYKERFRNNISINASNMGMDGDAFLQQYYNYSGGVDQFIEEYAEEAVKQDLAFQAVANQENIVVEDEELNQVLSEQAQAYGYTTVEEYVGETSLELYRTDLLLNKVYNFLMESAETGK